MFAVSPYLSYRVLLRPQQTINKASRTAKSLKVNKNIQQPTGEFSFYQIIGKRYFDFWLSIISVLVLLPLFTVLAVLVRIYIGTPIFFDQQRLGKNGTIFSILKFRTMTQEQNKQGELLSDEDRLPPFGKWLRSTSLDELPELFNVIRGEMSLVGPRPFVMRYKNRYSSRQFRRHDVRPGITGLAQINGRNEIAWEDKFEHDIFYVENHTLSMDLKILIATVCKVFRRDGISAEGEVTAPEFIPAEATHYQEFACKQKGYEGVSWPFFDSDQINAVVRVLQSGKVNYWTGKECKKFEAEYARFLGVDHAIAVANGTVALELALRAIGINSGDEVVVPSRTFVATASAVVVQGGTPVFADIDPHSQNITAETIQKAVTAKTKAIIVVHVGGWPCAMQPIMDLAGKLGLYVIEDCAQAHGAEYKGKPVGSFGHINAFSFCQDKIISTGGEGGIVVTNRRDLWERAWSFKDHGKSWDAIHNQTHAGSFRYVHNTIGTNYRMTEMQAAIGRIQLKKLPGWVRQRRDCAALLCSLLKSAPGLLIPEPSSDFEHSYYRVYVLIKDKQIRFDWSRDRIVQELRKLEIPVGSGSCGEVYKEQSFRKMFPDLQHQNAHNAQSQSLAFSVHPGLSQSDVHHISGCVKQVMRQATGALDECEKLRAA